MARSRSATVEDELPYCLVLTNCVEWLIPTPKSKADLRAGGAPFAAQVHLQRSTKTNPNIFAARALTALQRYLSAVP